MAAKKKGPKKPPPRGEGSRKDEKKKPPRIQNPNTRRQLDQIDKPSEVSSRGRRKGSKGAKKRRT